MYLTQCLIYIVGAQKNILYYHFPPFLLTASVFDVPVMLSCPDDSKANLRVYYFIYNHFHVCLQKVFHFTLYF